MREGLRAPVWPCCVAVLLLVQSSLGTTQTPSACPRPDEVLPVHLYGEWSLELWKGSAAAATRGAGIELVGRGTVHFERHPEFDGNVRGRVVLQEAPGPALLAGDVTDGELVLDESVDGVRIDAVWVGTPQDCARLWVGTRRPAEHRTADEPLLGFRLTKTTGWR